jgi:hypothetical protein
MFQEGVLNEPGCELVGGANEVSQNYRAKVKPPFLGEACGALAGQLPRLRWTPHRMRPPATIC